MKEGLSTGYWKNGLALAGGGARGAYQAGALMFLAAQGIRFDVVSGTSIGALNGAVYVQGGGSFRAMQRLYRLWIEDLPRARFIEMTPAASRVDAFLSFFGKGLPWLARVSPFLKQLNLSLLDPAPIGAVLDRILDYRKIRASRIQLIISVIPSPSLLAKVLKSDRDIQPRYFSAGDLSPETLRATLLASIAIPGVFPPVKIENRMYSDAGEMESCPLSVLSGKRLKRIVAIHLSNDTDSEQPRPGTARLTEIRPSRNIREMFPHPLEFSRDSGERLAGMGYRDAGNAVAVSRIRKLWFAMARFLHGQRLPESLVRDSADSGADRPIPR